MGCGGSKETKVEPKPPPAETVKPEKEPHPSSDGRWMQKPLVAKYPLHVMHVTDFQRLSELPPHQAAKRQGLVVALDLEGEHKGALINFVSHQWLGYKEADPDCAHLRTMQSVFARMSRGESVFRDAEVAEAYFKGLGKESIALSLLGVDAHHAEVLPETFQQSATDGWVWMDYLSIPQTIGLSTKEELQLAIRDQSNAIDSIHAYLASALNFFVCAPSGAVHCDTGAACNFASWRSRGCARPDTIRIRLALRAHAAVARLTCGVPFHISTAQGAVQKRLC